MFRATILETYLTKIARQFTTIIRIETQLVETLSARVIKQQKALSQQEMKMRITAVMDNSQFSSRVECTHQVLLKSTKRAKAI